MERHLLRSTLRLFLCKTRRIVRLLPFLIVTFVVYFSLSYWSHPGESKPKIIVFISDINHDFSQHLASVQCYAERMKYDFRVLSILDECAHVDHFFFQRVCSARLLLQRDRRSWHLFIDGDNHVVNFNRSLEAFFPKKPSQTLVLQERLFTNEIAVFSFMAKYSTFVDNLFKIWTSWGSKIKAQENVMYHNYDNGAFHLALLQAIGSPSYSYCESLYYESRYGTYALYDSFVGCARSALFQAGPSRDYVIRRKGQGFSRDAGDCTEWAPSDFMIHGMVKKNYGDERLLPFHFKKKITNCADDFVDLRYFTSIDNVRKAQQRAESAGRQERKPAFVGSPDWGSCYPNCRDASDVIMPTIGVKLFPTRRDYQCLWVRSTMAANAEGTWNDSILVKTADRFFWNQASTISSPPCREWGNVKSVSVDASQSAVPPLNKAGALLIPKLLHRSGPRPQTRSKFQNDTEIQWVRLHEDWKYIYWTDDMLETLIQSQLGWFYETWKSLQFNVMRYDASRVVMMYVYGGLYVDQDVECLQNNEALLRGAQVVLPADNANKHNNPWPGPHVDNWWMASVPRHPMFLSYLRYIVVNVDTWKVKKAKDGSSVFSTWRLQSDIQRRNSARMGAILMLTGPHTLGRVCTNFIDDYGPLGIRVLGRYGDHALLLEDNSKRPVSEEERNRAFALHRMQGSWVNDKK